MDNKNSSLIAIRRIDVGKDLTGPFLFVVDTSTLQQNLGTMVQRGSYTLANNLAFVSFPRAVLSAASAANITVHLTSRGPYDHSIASYAVASALGNVNISSVSGFTVSAFTSATVTDSGHWLCFAYR